MSLTLDLLLALLGLGQIVTGAISWYFGMQVKMLRLELVNKDSCHDRHEKLEHELSELRTELERVKLDRLKCEHCGANNA